MSAKLSAVSAPLPPLLVEHARSLRFSRGLQNLDAGLAALPGDHALPRARFAVEGAT